MACPLCVHSRTKLAYFSGDLRYPRSHLSYAGTLSNVIYVGLSEQAVLEPILGRLSLPGSKSANNGPRDE